MNSSKSWADVEDEFPPSPPRKPEPSPPVVRPIITEDQPVVTRIEAKQRPPVAPAPDAGGGPKPVPYLKMNRFTEPLPPKVKSTNNNSDRRLWEPAATGSDRLQKPFQQRAAGGSNRSLNSGSGGNKHHQKFELQLKNVPAEVTEDEVKAMLAGVNKVRRNAKNQLVFVELASKQALEHALAKKFPEPWEVKQVVPTGKQQQQAAVEPRKANKPAAAVATKPKKEKKKEEKKPVVAANAFGALYEDSESSSSSSSSEEEEDAEE